MHNLLAQVAIGGCVRYETYFIEIADEGSATANHAALQRRYAELNGGPFEPYHCEQSRNDTTYITFNLLNWKQSRKLYRKWRAGVAQVDIVLLSDSQ